MECLRKTIPIYWQHTSVQNISLCVKLLFWSKFWLKQWSSGWILGKHYVLFRCWMDAPNDMRRLMILGSYIITCKMVLVLLACTQLHPLLDEIDPMSLVSFHVNINVAHHFESSCVLFQLSIRWFLCRNILAMLHSLFPVFHSYFAPRRCFSTKLCDKKSAFDKWDASPKRW